jgi:hypothetical protein
MKQNRIFLSPPDVGVEERQLLLDAFDSNWIAPLGPHVDGFERELSEWVGGLPAVALSSGTAGLELGLRAVGVRPGDIVLVSSFTFAASAFAVCHLGAEPVFVDSENLSWNMDPDRLEQAISCEIKRGKKPAGVICVDLYGQCADYRRIRPRKYLRNRGKSPQQLQAKHTWRTRKDPLAPIWGQVEQMLQDAPELEAKTIFEHLLFQQEGVLNETHLRTFQRRVKQWRLCHGPDKEVYFPQVKTPGQFMQLDWTHASELKVSIGGHSYDHLLCHVVLPYSNWEWATRCHSESLLSLRHGLQEALFRLGKIPSILQIDNSSAATHQIGKGQDRFDAVILDDIGYVQQDRQEMEVLFTFLAERYERRSVMITSNLVFSKWDQIFKDPMTTMAAIDRLVHHATILEFSGESFRAKKAKEKDRS